MRTTRREFLGSYAAILSVASVVKPSPTACDARLGRRLVQAIEEFDRAKAAALALRDHPYGRADGKTPYAVVWRWEQEVHNPTIGRCSDAATAIRELITDAGYLAAIVGDRLHLGIDEREFMETDDLALGIGIPIRLVIAFDGDGRPL